MDFLSGSDVSLNVVFENDTQTLVPDTGSVKLNLRSETGTLLITNQTVTVPSGENSVSVEIDAAHNTLATGQGYAKRTVHITFTVDGQLFNLFIPYRIIPWLNHSVDVRKVRAALGVNFNDLPDEAIDIVQAYYEAEALLAESSVTLNDQLTAGGTDEFYANEIILCLAALKALPSLRLGVSQKEENGAISFARFSQAVDWEALQESLAARLATAQETLTNITTTTSTLLVFTTRTDPITGA